MVPDHGMNNEILPPEGKIQYLGQLITFKNAVHVEFKHRLKCVWATFTRHRQELMSPTLPLRDLKLFDATVTPSLLDASGRWTMTEEMKKLQTTKRRMMRMIVRTQRKSRTCSAAAHAAHLDGVADDEPHHPDSELEEDDRCQLTPNHKTPSTKKKATQTPTATPPSTAYRKTH